MLLLLTLLHIAVCYSHFSQYVVPEYYLAKYYTLLSHRNIQNKYHHIYLYTHLRPHQSSFLILQGVQVLVVHHKKQIILLSQNPAAYTMLTFPFSFLRHPEKSIFHYHYFSLDMLNPAHQPLHHYFQLSVFYALSLLNYFPNDILQIRPLSVLPRSKLYRLKNAVKSSLLYITRVVPECF